MAMPGASPLVDQHEEAVPEEEPPRAPGRDRQAG